MAISISDSVQCQDIECPVIQILLNNVCWCFLVFEYLLWVIVICKYLKRRNSKRGDVNVVEYTDMKSDTDLKSEFAKVIPISTVKPKSGQADKMFSLLKGKWACIKQHIL